MNTSTQHNKTRSAVITAFVHAGVIALGLIPLVRQSTTQFVEYAVPIEFSTSEGSAASAAEVVTKAVPEEVEVEEVVPTEEVIEEPMVEEMITAEEQEIPAPEVPEEAPEKTATEQIVEAAEVPSQSRADRSKNGQAAGQTAEGDDGAGKSGYEGDGIISRKIIYRSDISQVAVESGVIAVDVCIDRQGRILTAASDAEGTTMTNMDVVRSALDLVVQYRFETDYSAASRECGTLTFIFDVEKGETEVAGLIAAN